MFLTKVKAGVVVLLALSAMAILLALRTERSHADQDNEGPRAAAKADKPPAGGGEGTIQSKDRVLAPDGKRIYVNVSSTNEDINQESLFNYATVKLQPEIKRVRGVAAPRPSAAAASPFGSG